VLAGSATIANGAFVCEDSANMIVKILVCLKVLLRDFFAIVISQKKARELQAISVIKVILRREVVFFAFVDDFVIVCIHDFLPSQDSLIDLVKYDAFDFLRESLVVDDFIQGARVKDFRLESHSVSLSIFVEDVQLMRSDIIVRVDADFRPKVKACSVEGEGLVDFDVFHGVSLSKLWLESRDFFDLCDVKVDGVDHAQGFLYLMGYPTDPMGEHF
jgi:hypothetical protein